MEIYHQLRTNRFRFGVRYRDAEFFGEFRHSIGFVFPAPIGEHDKRYFIVHKPFQRSCASRDSVGAKHKNTIDVKGEGVIEFRLENFATAIAADMMSQRVGVRFRPINQNGGQQRGSAIEWIVLMRPFRMPLGKTLRMSRGRR